jgi:hypothetical protein
LTLTGAVQVRPPSIDLDSAMSSWVPLNRLSSHTTYSAPLPGSTAMSGRAPPMSAPVRSGTPVSGSRSCTTGLFEIWIGGDQCDPPSVERITPISDAFGWSNPDPFP